MSKKKPDIPQIPYNDRKAIKDFVLDTIEEITIFRYNPNTISISGSLYTLTFSDKEFVDDSLPTGSLNQHTDVYFKQTLQLSTTYDVDISGSDIIVDFNTSITENTGSVSNTDFELRGKIVEV